MFNYAISLFKKLVYNFLRNIMGIEEFMQEYGDEKVTLFN